LVDHSERIEGTGIANERQELSDGTDKHLPVIANRQVRGDVTR
jgi:hypothetical protein